MYHELPVDAYTSWEWYQREQDRIFSRVWRYAGFAEDISEPGQYISVQAGANNILIVMGRDHRLRAFHNICRHRGTQLLRATGKAQRAVTCPYHDWTYDLEGCLIAVPNAEREYPSGIDKSQLGLKAASVDIWRGMLFVHPDPPERSPSLAEWFGAVDPHLGPVQPAELTEIPAQRTSMEVKANWKILVENYVDVYHLSHLHSATLDMYDHAKAEYGWHGSHYAFWEPLVAMDGDRHDNGGRGGSGDHGAWVPMLFPGIGFATSDSEWSTYIITPLAPDLTRVESRTKRVSKSTWNSLWSEWPSTRGRPEGQKAKVGKKEAEGRDDPLASGNFIAEDNYVCEQQQKSMTSPFFEVGPAAQGESPVVNHQRVVLSFLK
ncbi:aromatic ring-hydroxylating oxygenase subunit alpha [Streptomyces sp. MUM 178J]|uniref:aromatic ring-hydroxylating oxygenase subunit alpha n=1 Tax=Streptomyces sp. MUM 178J TaxID=2791991 RepID=UPI001F042023|nr:SRPBCC family protein [Streptomyces sp. MUM 178J]WRQ82882.1 Rieske 2Fe-2S domain-containing protein [Streptomyces sp. MUM 178J]